MTIVMSAFPNSPRLLKGGIVLVDPISPDFAAWLKGELGTRFPGKAVKYIVYSHSHWDHVSGIPDESLAALEGLDVWIIDALRERPHPSHFTVAEALEWIARLRPRRAILTNMHTDLDYEVLRASLPPNVEPAYDGMRVEAGASE